MPATSAHMALCCFHTLKMKRWPSVENRGASLLLAPLRVMLKLNGEFVVWRSYVASFGGLADPGQQKCISMAMSGSISWI